MTYGELLEIYHNSEMDRCGVYVNEEESFAIVQRDGEIYRATCGGLGWHDMTLKEIITEIAQANPDYDRYRFDLGWDIERIAWRSVDEDPTPCCKCPWKSECDLMKKEVDDIELQDILEEYGKDEEILFF